MSPICEYTCANEDPPSRFFLEPKSISNKVDDFDISVTNEECDGERFERLRISFLTFSGAAQKNQTEISFWHDFVMPEGITWLYLMGVGIATQIGQVALTKGMQTETASRATSFSYLQVVFAVILGFLFYQEMPDLWTWAGASLILLGAYLNVSLGNKRSA